MRKLVGLSLFGFLSAKLMAQGFISIWPEGKMPNSKGMILKDSISNERVFQVGKPGFYAFFPSLQEHKRAAVLIYPGGGYQRLAYNISGFQLAKWFNTLGISAFVLNYRLPISPDLINPENGPIADAQRAIKIIRQYAKDWNIDAHKIGVMGSSAGGHLAALQSTLLEDFSIINDAIDSTNYLPNFTILVSPVIDMGTYAHRGSKENLLGKAPSLEIIKKFSPHLNVNSKTPICFIADAFNDQSVNPQNSLLYYQALLMNKIPTSFHVFPQGGHAIALRNNPGSTQQWTNLCEAWLIETNFLN
jgi:acetyl esterase/lipase